MSYIIIIAVILFLGLIFLNVLRLLSHGAKEGRFIGLFCKRNLVFLATLFVVGLFRLKIWADAPWKEGVGGLAGFLRSFLPLQDAAGAVLGGELTLGPALDVVLVLCAVFVAIKTGMIFIFDYAIKRGRKVDVPGIIRAIIRWSAYLLAVILVLHFVLRWDVSSLLAGSAVVSLVLGFALQDTLSNLFIGLSIHFERSAEIGQWIKVGDFEGQVVGVTWRAVNIRTFAGDHVIIPNSEFGKMEVVNFSMPTPVHAINVWVGTSYSDPPNKVREAALEACARTPGVLKEPAPYVFTESYGDFSITYRVKAWINGYARVHHVEGDLRSNIWYVFRRRGITIPFPIRDVRVRQVREVSEEEERGRCVQMLKRVYFLGALKEEDFRTLADGMREVMYAAGDEVVREGEEGDEFFMGDGRRVGRDEGRARRRRRHCGHSPQGGLLRRDVAAHR